MFIISCWSYEHSNICFMICIIFVQSAEQRKQNISDIKVGIDEAEALVPSSLFSSCLKASFLSSVLWPSDMFVLIDL